MTNSGPSHTHASRWMPAALALLVFVLLAAPKAAQAYSLQTHEQLVDLTWKNSIVPLLRSRFPSLTEAQIAEAHAYAYGGCAIQDIGYYPFGNALFSDLTHYVRAGDFVASLLRNARTPDELAFAVGALTHYIGDIEGHSIATNPAVAVEFPKLGSKFGPSVNYEENPHAHVRTEFAFDINEISKHRFAPLKYLEHVGLFVSTDLLQRAFYETYGLDLRKILKLQKTTVAGYRFGVRHFLPRIAYAETLLHRHSFPPDIEDEEFLKLKADLAQASADNIWEPYRRKAGIGTHLLAGFIFIVPKFGVASMLSIKGPDPATEQLYVRSLNRSIDDLRKELLHLQSQPLSQPHTPNIRQAEIVNRDLDTGAPVTPGSYRLTDETYARLLADLTQDTTRKIPYGLRQDILSYYADRTAPISTKKKAKQWAQVQVNLATIRQMSIIQEP